MHNIDNFPSIQCKTLPKNNVQNSSPAVKVKSGGQNNVKNNNVKSGQGVATATGGVCSAAGVKPSKGNAQLGINVSLERSVFSFALEILCLIQ